MKKTTIQDFMQATLASLNGIVNKSIADKDIILSFDQIGFSMHIERLKDQLKAVNKLVIEYCELFSGKVIAPAILNELAEFKVHKDSLETDIKIAYVTHHKVSLNVPFKKESIALSYDFTPREQSLISTIAATLLKLQSRAKLLDFAEYWNGKSFVLSVDTISKIGEEYTVYATSEDIRRILAVDLILIGGETLESCGHRINLSDFHEFMRDFVDKKPGVMMASKMQDFSNNLMKGK